MISRLNRRSNQALLASSIATPWFFGWLLLIAALRPEYTHATKAVSELGAWGAPYMTLWNVFGFIVTGVLLLGFAWGYRQVLGREAVGAGGLALSAALFCLTAIPIVIGADSDPDRTSLWTQAHLVPVLLSPLPWVYATIRIAIRFRRSSLSILSLLSALGLVAFIAVLIASGAQMLPHAPGLLQRVSFLVYLGWYSASSWALLRWVARRSTGANPVDDGLAAPAAAVS
jgi:hypothetical protein